MKGNNQTNGTFPKGLVEVLLYLLRLATGKFDGTIELRFEAGNVVHLTEHKSLKPDSLPTPDNLRSNHDNPFVHETSNF